MEFLPNKIKKRDDVFFLSYMHPSNGRGVKLMTLKKRFMGDNP
jgi:hypothetical protein